MKKVLLIGGGGVLLVLVVFIWQVVTNLDSIVAGVIEDVGTDVLQSKVTVSDVSIELSEGKAGVGEITIANPAGYSSANIFTMEGIQVDIDLQSLGSDVLVIESIRIQNPQIVLEDDGAGGSNMQTLLDNIESASAGAVGDNTTRMIIKQFVFSGGQVRVTTVLKRGKTLELKLPPIKISDIGQAEGGVTADVVMEQVVGKLARRVMEQALKAGINRALKDKQKRLEGVLKAVLKGEG